MSPDVNSDLSRMVRRVAANPIPEFQDVGRELEGMAEAYDEMAKASEEVEARVGEIRTVALPEIDPPGQPATGPIGRGALRHGAPRHGAPRHGRDTTPRGRDTTPRGRDVVH